MVTIAFGPGFSWFGFIAGFSTASGIAGYALGWALGLRSLESGVPVVLYSATLGVLTAMALAAGLWWFVAGTGEARLEGGLRDAYGEYAMDAENAS